MLAPFKVGALLGATVVALTLPVSLAKSASKGYDFNAAKMACGYAGAAYCSARRGKGVDNWSFKYANWGGMVALNATSFYGPDTDTNGYVGYDGHASIWVSFAGTDPLSIRSWIDDLNFPKTTDHPACDGCKVHEGFLASWTEVSWQVTAQLKSLVKKYPGAKIHLTGHSLGAAMSTLALVDLILVFGADKFGAVYNFGSPRIGNAAFSKHIASIDVEVFRSTHGHDPVPHLPARGFYRPL